MAYHADVLVDGSGKTKCGLCKIFISDSNVEIERHLNDKNHVKMNMQRLMVQNNIVAHNRQVICGLCDQIFDQSSIINHINSSRHQDMKASVEELIKNDGGLLLLPENITNLGSKVNCLACDCFIDFEFASIKSHIGSAKHRRARAMAVQPMNAIFSVEDSNDDLWCKICQVYFENYIEIIFEHVDEDPVHRKKLGKLLMLINGQNISIEKFLYDPREDKAYCKKCDIEVPCNVDNLERHIKGKKHNT
ncbi:unnamed protein product [Chrysodeixis includens]|uniref:U1-type domain-containing protein n=1 Tax=Chrysodeixis includens TaxID=689277 RepID=A0A9P0FRM8_CHRIL|nr:unnamed protein product [Chrysodeixis includens]